MSHVYVEKLATALRKLLAASENHGLSSKTSAHREASAALLEVETELAEQKTAAREQLRELAELEYGSDDVSFDDGVYVSEADHGVWVSAWVWVYNALCDCGEFLDSPIAAGSCNSCKQKGKTNGKASKAK